MFGVTLLCAPELNFPPPVLLLIYAAVDRRSYEPEPG